MKIGIIWDADYPWDVRVEKVTKALLDEGHDVHLICRNQAMKDIYEKDELLHIHRLPVYFRFSRYLNSLVTFPAFFNVFWLVKMFQVIKRNKIEYLIVRDLPLCPAALLMSRIFRIPCSMDMAECYPELLRCIWRFESFKLRNIFVRNPAIADLVERFCIRRLDKIFVMIEESRDRLLDMGVPAERIVIVSNTPSVHLIDLPLLAKNSNRITLLYLGIINPSRGLNTVINGIELLRKRGVDCLLKIAGTGKAKCELERRVRSLGLETHVEFLGWVNRESIEDLLAVTDVGIVPHHICSHWNSTIPNKLFDYMVAGIPVLSTDVIPMSRIITTYNCGVIYNDENVESFSDSVVTMLDAEKRYHFGYNGKKAVDNYFNWENDSKRLISSLPEV